MQLACLLLKAESSLLIGTCAGKTEMVGAYFFSLHVCDVFIFIVIAFFACLDANNENKEACTKEYDAFKQTCIKSWVCTKYSH